MPRLAIVSLVLLALVPACKDTPSYELRWTVVGRLDTTPDPSPPAPQPERPRLDVTMAYHCSQHGITAVRVRAIDELGVEAHADVHPCFPEEFEDLDGAIVGPQLRAGRYALEVRGVQRDLKGWIDDAVLAGILLEDPEYLDRRAPPQHCAPGAETLGCRVEDLVCECRVIEARADETITDLDPFELHAPGDCIDGVDNDIDGLVDGEDPGCAARPLQESNAGDCSDGSDNDGDGRADGDDADCFLFEAGDVSIVQFELRVTMLDDNPAATCEGVSLTNFRVTARAPTVEPIVVATTECRIGAPVFFSAELPTESGPYTIDLVGLDVDGEPLTVAIPFDATVSANTDAIVVLETDLGAEVFEPPLLLPSQFLLAFEQDPETGETRYCTPGASDGTLVIDELSLRLVDGAGEPVPDAAPLDGTPQACTADVKETLVLPWGSYAVVAEARAADGTVCFASPPAGEPLAPGIDEPAIVVLERVLVGGAPPAPCIDCTSDADCGGDRCDGGICR